MLDKESKYVPYKGGLLARGSDAYRLHQEKKWAELDKHLAQTRAAAVKRGEIRE